MNSVYSHTTTSHTTIGTVSMRAKIAMGLAIVAAALALYVPGASASHSDFGANFGMADAVDSAGNPLPVFGADSPGDDAFWMGVCDTNAGDTTGTGMGTPGSALDCFDHGHGYTPANVNDPDPTPPWITTWQPGEEPDWRLNMVDQAGAHPDTTVSFWYRRYPHSVLQEFGSTIHHILSDGEPKDVIVKLPPGFVGNPNAVPQCPASAVRQTPPPCHPNTQVGVATLALPEGGNAKFRNQRVPIYNVEPRDGKLAEFVIPANINAEDRVNVPVVAKARTDGDFGIDTMAVDLPSGLPVLGQTITFWGVPWADSHDAYRVPSQYVRTNDPNGQEGIPEGGLPDPSGNQPQSYDRTWGPVLPFLSNPTECDSTAPPVTEVLIASWRNPGSFISASHEWDQPIDGCQNVPFDASFDMSPTSNVADGPTGLSTDIAIPQIGESPFDVPDDGATPAEVDDYVDDATEFWRSGDSGNGPTSDHLSSSQLKDAVVTLPEGVSINPASAGGLEGCTDAQVGLTQSGAPPLFNNEDPFDGQGAECPDGSKIGTVEVYSPVLPLTDGDQPGDPNLVGDVVFGMPKSTDPTSGEMFRLFLVLRSEKRGLLAKVAGSAVADPQTGQLTTTFQQNPRVPFETMHLELKGGDQGTLALQQRCEPEAWSSMLTPWTAAHGAGGSSVSDGGSFTPSTNCAFGFDPGVRAGMSNRAGGGSGEFSFTMTRNDGEQRFSGLTTEMPKGLLATVGSVPLCTDVQAAAAACPEASRIGTVDAGAGSGTPYFLEKKGAAYLTEGYKGAPFGMATIVPIEAGPFSGPLALSTMVVRQALRVDPDDATASIVSDPLPQIWHGIPLRLRQVMVKVDRSGFMRNPTDCSPKEIVTTVTSTEGTVDRNSTPFQATACGQLGYSPKLAMRLVGKRQTTSGKHPTLRAVMTQSGGQANTSRAEVRLPKALALDPNNSTDPALLCGYDAGLAGDCPDSSIVGRATATSPLLSRPLSGPVHLVQGIRFGPTGNRIRTLPTLLVKLRGEVALNVRARSDVKRGRLVSIFENLPDAALSKFSMQINGGAKGILVVTERNGRAISICGPQTAESDLDAHNGRRYDRTLKIKTPCAKRKKASCKTAKQRRTAACKRRRGSA